MLVDVAMGVYIFSFRNSLGPDIKSQYDFSVSKNLFYFLTSCRLVEGFPLTKPCADTLRR